MPQETRQRKRITPRAVLLSAVESAAAAGGDDRLIDEIWSHANVVSRIARALAPAVDVDPSDAAAAGLLHDIGELLLLARHPREYVDVLSVPRSHRDQLAAEKGELGIDHALLGAQHLLDLHVVDAVADAVADHHDPFRDSALTTVVVAAADEIVDPDRCRRHALDLLGIAPGAAASILRTAVGDPPTSATQTACAV